MRTGSGGFVAVEFAIQRRQIVDDAFEIDLDAMHQPLAFEAVPLEGIEHAFRALRFDHKTNRSLLRPLRRMPDMRRQQKDFALPDRHVVMLSVVDDLEHHVATQLIKELLDRIVVKIGAPVRAADHGDHQIRVLPDLLVADRRLQQMLVFVDPFREIEGLQAFTHLRFSRYTVVEYLYPVALRTAPVCRPQASKARRVAARSSSVSASNGGRTAPPTWPSRSCQYF